MAYRIVPAKHTHNTHMQRIYRREMANHTSLFAKVNDQLRKKDTGFVLLCVCACVCERDMIVGLIKKIYVL